MYIYTVPKGIHSGGAATALSLEYRGQVIVETIHFV